MRLHAQRLLGGEARRDLRTAFLDQPNVKIDLMFGATKDNDPFFARIVREFYDEARAPRRDLPLVSRVTWGVALIRLPTTFAEYFADVEAAARRNYKKAERLGYVFERLEPNRWLEEIVAVRSSMAVRQGPMPASILAAQARPCLDPPTRTDVHDYPWFGVRLGDHLAAYATCLVAGELCMIESIYGHAEHEENGVVPRLILGIAEEIYARYPHVRFFAYGGYFGAGETMRRFKRKFGFQPHHVEWVLGEGAEAVRPSADGANGGEKPREVVVAVPPSMNYQLVYRYDCRKKQHASSPTGAAFHYLDNPIALLLLARTLRTRMSPTQLAKAAAKLASGRRHYYVVVLDGRVVSDGWVSFGFCRHYWIEPHEAVIGPVWTDAAHRGKGLASFALSRAVDEVLERGTSVTYIDTARDNVGMQKAIARVGYGAPVAVFPRIDEAPARARVSGWRVKPEG
jgi:RimJ/RimL family protein N-acetyltransferase